MARYGKLVDNGKGSFSWTIDDIMSLDSIRSPTFEYQSIPFHIRLSVHSREDRLQVSVHTEITKSERYQVSVELEMATGIEEAMESRSGRMDTNGDFFVRRWMPWTEMLSRRLDILPNGVLEVTCVILSVEILPSRRVTPQGEEDLEENKEKDFEHKTIKKLQKDLENLFKSNEDCDVTIKVQNKEFPTHSLILRARSPVFKSMFSLEMLEKLSGVVVIDDCDPDTFPDFLTYLYTGSIKHISKKNVCHLFTASDKYQVDDLREGCVEFMKSNLSVETFCDFLTLALMHTLEDLIDLATEFFSDNVVNIAKTAKWQIFLKEKSTVANELFLNSLSR